jgi:hypothetical protein
MWWHYITFAVGLWIIGTSLYNIFGVNQTGGKVVNGVTVSIGTIISYGAFKDLQTVLR